MYERGGEAEGGGGSSGRVKGVDTFRHLTTIHAAGRPGRAGPRQAGPQEAADALSHQEREIYSPADPCQTTLHFPKHSLWFIAHFVKERKPKEGY